MNAEKWIKVNASDLPEEAELLNPAYVEELENTMRQIHLIARDAEVWLDDSIATRKLRSIARMTAPSPEQNNT